ncbi:MAG: CheR family methyltransferase, partial [Candidatus Omnitrophota bacterium]
TVAVVSQAGLKAAQRIGAEDVVLVGPMCNVNAFGPSKERLKIAMAKRQEYSLEGKFVILAPGRIARDKGAMELLRALNILINKGYEKVRVVLIGESRGEFRQEVDEFVRYANLREKITFLGQMNHKDLAIWYLVSDMTVLPSYTDGFGLTIAEAELSERFVLATQAGGIPEAMVNRKTGLVVNFDLNRTKKNREEIVAYNSLILARGIEEALKMPVEQRNAMGQAGRRFVLDNFDPAKLIERHEKLLSSSPKCSSSPVSSTSLLSQNRIEEIILARRTLDTPYQIFSSVFFWNYLSHLINLEDILEPIIKENNLGGKKIIRIWSAGCGLGMEAGTIAIIAAKLFKDNNLEIKDQDIKILATDNNFAVLEEARRGEYLAEEVVGGRRKGVKEGLPHGYKSEDYFDYKQQVYRIKPEIRKLIEFYYSDLGDQSSRLVHKNIDVIFCEWVFEYIEENKRYTVAKALVASLKNNGVIFTSGMEQPIFSRLSKEGFVAMYKSDEIGGGYIYQKKNYSYASSPVMTRAPIFNQPIEYHSDIYDLIKNRVKELGGGKILVLNADAHEDYDLGNSLLRNIGNWGSRMEQDRLGYLVWLRSYYDGSNEARATKTNWSSSEERGVILEKIKGYLDSGEIKEIWLTFCFDFFSLRTRLSIGGMVFWANIFNMEDKQIENEMRKIKSFLIANRIPVARIVPAISRQYLSLKNGQFEEFIENVIGKIKKVFEAVPAKENWDISETKCWLFFKRALEAKVGFSEVTASKKDRLGSITDSYRIELAHKDGAMALRVNRKNPEFTFVFYGSAQSRVYIHYRENNLLQISVDDKPYKDRYSKPAEFNLGFYPCDLKHDFNFYIEGQRDKFTAVIQLGSFPRGLEKLKDKIFISESGHRLILSEGEFNFDMLKTTRLSSSSVKEISVERICIVGDCEGVHEHNIQQLVELANKFSSRIYIQYKNRTSNLKNVLDSLSEIIDAVVSSWIQVTEIKLIAEGEDAESAVDTLATFINEGFGEGILNQLLIKIKNRNGSSPIKKNDSWVLEGILNRLLIDKKGFLANAPPSSSPVAILINPDHASLRSVKPLGLARISASLKANDIAVEFIDANKFSLPIEDLVNKVVAFSVKYPQEKIFLGLSLFPADKAYLANFLNLLPKELKSNRRFFISAGGYLPSISKDSFLKEFPDIDFIVAGEGELAFAKAIKQLSENKDLGGVENVIYRNQEGKIINNPHYVLTTEDLDKLPPPDWSIINDKADRFTKVAQLDSSRGCPGFCAFCGIHKFFNEAHCSNREDSSIRAKDLFWRSRSAIKVVDEIEYLMRFGITGIDFVDDDFIGTQPERARKIADEIIKRGLKISFWILTRSDTVTEDNKEMFVLLKKAGLKQVFLGVESNDPAQLKYFAKGIIPEQNRQAIKIFQKIGIFARVGLINFSRESSLQQIRNNTEFIENYGLQASIATPASKLRIYINTLLYRKYTKQGIELIQVGGLEFDYEFIDPQVASLYEITKKFADKTYKAMVYFRELQELSYYDFDSEIGKRATECYQKLKEIEFEFFKEALDFIDGIETKYSISEIELKYQQKIENIIGHFAEWLEAEEGYEQEIPFLKKAVKPTALTELKEILTQEGDCWVKFGDMKKLYDRNNAFSREVMDFLINKAIEIVDNVDQRFGGFARHLVADEILSISPKECSKEEIEKISYLILFELTQYFKGIYAIASLDILKGDAESVIIKLKETESVKKVIILPVIVDNRAENKYFIFFERVGQHSLRETLKIIILTVNSESKLKIKGKFDLFVPVPLLPIGGVRAASFALQDNMDEWVENILKAGSMLQDIAKKNKPYVLIEESVEIPQGGISIGASDFEEEREALLKESAQIKQGLKRLPYKKEELYPSFMRIALYFILRDLLTHADKDVLLCRLNVAYTSDDPVTLKNMIEALGSREARRANDESNIFGFKSFEGTFFHKAGNTLILLINLVLGRFFNNQDQGYQVTIVRQPPEVFYLVIEKDTTLPSPEGFLEQLDKVKIEVDRFLWKHFKVKVLFEMSLVKNFQVANNPEKIIEEADFLSELRETTQGIKSSITLNRIKTFEDISGKRDEAKQEVLKANAYRRGRSKKIIRALLKEEDSLEKLLLEKISGYSSSPINIKVDGILGESKISFINILDPNISIELILDGELKGEEKVDLLYSIGFNGRFHRGNRVNVIMDLEYKEIGVPVIYALNGREKDKYGGIGLSVLEFLRLETLRLGYSARFTSVQSRKLAEMIKIFFGDLRQAQERSKGYDFDAIVWRGWLNCDIIGKPKTWVSLGASSSPVVNNNYGFSGRPDPTKRTLDFIRSMYMDRDREAELIEVVGNVGRNGKPKHIFTNPGGWLGEGLVARRNKWVNMAGRSAASEESTISLLLPVFGNKTQFTYAGDLIKSNEWRFVEDPRVGRIGNSWFVSFTSVNANGSHSTVQFFDVASKAISLEYQISPIDVKHSKNGYLYETPDGAVMVVNRNLADQKIKFYRFGSLEQALGMMADQKANEEWEESVVYVAKLPKEYRTYFRHMGFNTIVHSDDGSTMALFHFANYSDSSRKKAKKVYVTAAVWLGSDGLPVAPAVMISVPSRIRDPRTGKYIKGAEPNVMYFTAPLRLFKEGDGYRLEGYGGKDDTWVEYRRSIKITKDTLQKMLPKETPSVSSLILKTLSASSPVKSKDNYGEQLYYVADLAFKKGHYSAALECLKELILWDPQDANSFAYYLKVANKSKDIFDLAFQKTEEIIGKINLCPVGYYLRSFFHLKMRNFKAGLEDLNSAIRLSQTSKDRAVYLFEKAAYLDTFIQSGRLYFYGFDIANELNKTVSEFSQYDKILRQYVTPNWEFLSYIFLIQALVGKNEYQYAEHLLDIFFKKSYLINKKEDRFLVDKYIARAFDLRASIRLINIEERLIRTELSWIRELAIRDELLALKCLFAAAASDMKNASAKGGSYLHGKNCLTYLSLFNKFTMIKWDDYDNAIFCISYRKSLSELHRAIAWLLRKNGGRRFSLKELREANVDIDPKDIEVLKAIKVIGTIQDLPETYYYGDMSIFVVSRPQVKSNFSASSPVKKIEHLLIDSNEIEGGVVALRNNKSMVKLPVVRAGLLNAQGKLYGIESFERWLSFEGEPKLEHLDVIEYIKFLEDAVEEPGELYLVLSSDNVQLDIEAWINLEVVINKNKEDNYAVLEISPWNRLRDQTNRRYLGLGHELRVFGINKLLKIDPELKDNSVRNKIRTLGNEDISCDIFSDGVTLWSVEEYLTEQLRKRVNFIERYGLSSSPAKLQDANKAVLLKAFYLRDNRILVASQQEYNWSRIWQNIRLPQSEFMVRLLNENLFKNNEKILSLGCGRREDEIILARDIGCFVTATDISPVCINKITKEALRQGISQKLAARIQDLLNHFSFSDEEFDTAFANCCLISFDDKKMMSIVDEIWRVLKRGGKVFGMVYSKDDNKYGRGLPLDKDLFNINGMPYRFFDSESLEKSFKGFINIKIRNARVKSLDGETRRMLELRAVKPLFRDTASSPVESSSRQVIKGFVDAKRKAGKKIVGIPKEIKSGEKRVGLTRKEVTELVKLGVLVLIEKGAGLKSDITDRQFRQAGAIIVNSAEEVWKYSDIIKKVKEPLLQEYKYFREGLIIYTYFHLANPGNKELTLKLLESKVTAIAYESVKIGNATPLLIPMSRIAGWVAGVWAVLYRRVDNNYPQSVNKKTDIILRALVRKANRALKPLYSRIIQGLKALKSSDFRFSPEFLLSLGLPNDGPGNAVVLGGGHVGIEAALMSLLLGAKKVTISEINPKRRAGIRLYFRKQGFKSKVAVINPGENLAEPRWRFKNALKEADLIVGGVYSRTEKGSAIARLIIDERLLGEISREKKKIIIDVAIDQGGNVTPAFTDKYKDIFTSHSKPGRLDKFGNLRFSVPNMPAAFGKIASPYLNEATQPILLALINDKPIEDILSSNPEIKTGICVRNGRLLDSEVAEAHSLGASSPVISSVIAALLGIRSPFRTIRVSRLIKKLVDSNFDIRYDAARDLKKLGFTEEQITDFYIAILTDLYFSRAVQEGKKNIAWLKVKEAKLEAKFNIQCQQESDLIEYLNQNQTGLKIILAKQRQKTEESLSSTRENLSFAEEALAALKKNKSDLQFTSSPVSTENIDSLNSLEMVFRNLPYKTEDGELIGGIKNRKGIFIIREKRFSINLSNDKQYYHFILQVDAAEFKETFVGNNIFEIRRDKLKMGTEQMYYFKVEVEWGTGLGSFLLYCMLRRALEHSVNEYYVYLPQRPALFQHFGITEERWKIGVGYHLYGSGLSLESIKEA